MERIIPILNKLAEYGNLVFTGLAVMLGGMIAVFLLYRLVSSLLRPEATYARLLKVVFAACYVMILVVTVLLAADRFGYDVSGYAGISILAVIVLATIAFFLIPFLPRLPFVPGDVIETRGVMGVVEAITAYQTVIRNFDGQIVYIPSAMVMTSAISNFTRNPQRRIALDIRLDPHSNLERAHSLLVEVMAGHEAVHATPAPAVYIIAVSGENAQLMAYCWVDSRNWFSGRDQLWRLIIAAIAAEPELSLALPQLALQQPLEPNA